MVIGGFVKLSATNKTPEATEQTSIKEEINFTEGEDTRDWNTFVHEGLGFSMKYPEHVVIWKDTPEWVVFTSKEYAETDYFPAVAIQVINRDNSDNSVDVALLNETPVVSGQRKTNSRTIRINNAVGVEVLGDIVSEHPYYLNDEGKKGPVVRLSIGNDIAYENPDISSLKKMITTFRFER